MTTEQTTQQLELAAQILRTGHPFEVRHDTSDKWLASLGVNPAQAILQNWHLRPVLATPPDNRPLHNPDNLTAEQVGVGYRLFLTSEKPNTHVKLQEKWKVDEWVPSGVIYADPLTPESNTYRLPLSVPWPEPADPFAELKAAHAAGKVIQILNHQNRYVDADPTWTSPVEYYRIKPDAPPFQLPPPPPGMSWHRVDGWKAKDLPSGYRPLVEGETIQDGDEVKNGNSRAFCGAYSSVQAKPEQKFVNQFCRTTRPLTFEHAGKTWTYHRPGNPMPCDGGSLIWVLYDEGTHSLNSYCANDYVWGRVIGWRYAEPQTKTVPLGPEDVPPGSVFRRKEESGDYIVPTSVYVGGIYGHDEIVFRHTWAYLMSEYQINRSLPLTGKWNPDAWEPCSKTIPA